MAVCAFVTVQGLAQSSQGVQEGEEQATALGQYVLDVRGAASVIAAFYEVVLFHVAQTLDQRAAADGMQGGQQFGRASRPAAEVADDKHRPLVANHLQRARHGATVTFSSSHAFSAPPELRNFGLRA
ncbi:MAG: hypothetical protein QOD00_4147 [Blastocatellia bacterium]|jgi:hypothetical protein|nr:hypothetical protein [Blastocatellia bacterium]